MSKLKLKRSVFVSQTVEQEFDARELAETFTDDQLHTIGLFRDLRDADIQRERKLDELTRRERMECDDDECDCVLHTRTMKGGSAMRETALREVDFWPLIRALVLRHDEHAVMAELERRAWDQGNITIDFSRAFNAKG